MPENGLYGHALGSRVRLNHAPALVARSPRRTEIAVTQLKCATPNHGMTEPMPYDDAYLAVVQVGHTIKDLWLDGRPVPSEPLPPGSLIFHDLRQTPKANFRSSFHTLNFYLPRAALHETTESTHARRVDSLSFRPGVGYTDATVRNLSFLLLPTFAQPEQASRMFVDSVMVAIVAHIAKTYGTMAATTPIHRGGLAPWQERRAKELITANLEGDVTVSRLAAECSLSSSHFIRCFRQTTGIAPHQWLLQRRVETAKDMLPKPDMSLSEIALACGFADQSHFTRVFKRLVGVSPGAWKRRNRTEDSPRPSRLASLGREPVSLAAY